MHPHVQKKPVTALLTPLEYAKPSFTHMVISTLVALGKARYVCSQNVDSLHLRSGVPRPALAELHGNCFAERCQACRSEYMRDFQVETIDFQPTGRRCVRPGCQGVLVDNLLDWESALPDDELDASIEAAERSGLCLVLGSSLQISPANEIPLNTRSKGGELVIVNLQAELDMAADIARCCTLPQQQGVVAGGAA
ncbi:NADH-dependent histone deacetylase, partial [Haematococcus lacustris]